MTNGFSQKAANLEHAVSLHFMHDNFARVLKTLRVTPAMEAGISDHVWSSEENTMIADCVGNKKPVEAAWSWWWAVGRLYGLPLWLGGGVVGLGLALGSRLSTWRTFFD